MTAWLASLQWKTPGAGLLALLPFISLALSVFRQHRVYGYAEVALRPWALRTPGRVLGTGQWLLLAVFWWLMAAAAAGPYRLQTSAIAGGSHVARNDVEIMVVVDAANIDVKSAASRPSTWETVRRALHDFTAAFQGERIGLVSYTTRADLLLSPSHDYSLLPFYYQFIAEVSARGQATALADALYLAQQTLLHDKATSRVVLLLAQTPPSSSTSITRMTESLASDDIALAVMPLNTNEYDGLKDFTRSAKGMWLPPRQGPAAWAQVYEELIAPLPSQAVSQGVRRVEQHVFAWFLVPALLLWALPVMWQWLATRWMILASVALLLVLNPLQGLAQETLGQAYAAYSRGEYARAQELFSRAQTVAARLGEGASAYQQGQYVQAQKIFKRVALFAGHDNERADALFNLGNAYYRLQRYALAAQSYYGSLDYRPDDKATRYNFWQARRHLIVPEDSNRKGMRPGLRAGDGPAQQWDEEGEPEFIFSDLEDGATNSVGTEAGQRVARGEALAQADYRESRRLFSLRFGRQAEARAVLKKLELIEDQPASGLRALFEREAVLREPAP